MMARPCLRCHCGIFGMQADVLMPVVFLVFVELI